MAKIRMPEKVESKPTYLQSQHISDKFKYSKSNNRSFDDLNHMINGVQSIKIFKSIIVNSKSSSKMIIEPQNNQSALKSNFACENNNVISDDEKSDKLSDEDDDEDDGDDDNEGRIGSQAHSMDRSTGCTEAFYWPSSAIVQQNDNSTDYDTSAKAILTDCEHKKKIEFCLDKLSNMNQEQRPMTNTFTRVCSDFTGASSSSPPQQQQQQQQQQEQQQHEHEERQQRQQRQQQWQSNRSLGDLQSRDSCHVASITVSSAETSHIDILYRGGFRPAQSSSSPLEHSCCTGSGVPASRTCATGSRPDSPGGSGKARATLSSRPSSRASSSRAPSPSCTGAASFSHALSSPMGSPQVSPQNFYNRQRPSSSSSSSHSYCETPSPGNYQNPLDQHLEEQLGDHIMTRLPIWRENFNSSSDNLVNSVDNSELQLQLIEEVIRGDMNDQMKNRSISELDLQVVPNCKSSSFSNFTNIYSIINNNQMLTSEGSTFMDNSEAADDLTNTLLRFVRGEQTAISPKKLETRSNSVTSGYSGSGNGGNEARKTCNGARSHIELMRNNYLETSKAPSNQFMQHKMVYEQQCTNLNYTTNNEDSQFCQSQDYGNGRNSWPNYSEANLLSGTPATTNNFSDFRIPETVMVFNSQRVESSNKFSSNGDVSIKRSIAPWPSLNLPFTRATERLKQVTDPLEVERAMKNLLKRPLDQLTRADKDGDTMLMCLVGNPLELGRKLAYLAPLVERLGTIDGALSSLNNRGEDALYLAAMNCPQMSFVAGYLAAACLQKNIDITQRLYRSRGDTLVHALAAKGDGHGEVLAELLSLKTAQGNSVFDLLKRNYDGRTALHIAAESHGSIKRNMKIVSIGVIQLLLGNGADPLIREVRCGDTALSLAISTSCDPEVVKILLSGRGQQAINIANYNGNTPLHVAAIISERTSLERQLQICRMLMDAGGKANMTNLQGKTPVSLVSEARKEAVRRVFHKII